MKLRKMLGYVLMVAMIFNFITPAATMVYADAIDDVLTQIDLSLINNGSYGKVYGDLDLPTTLSGKEIVWTSDHEALEVTGEIGKIKKLYVNQTIPVSLTAEVTDGVTTKSKEIVIELAYNDFPNPPIDNNELLFDEDFDGKTFVMGGEANDIEGLLTIPSNPNDGWLGNGDVTIENDKLKVEKDAEDAGNVGFTYYFNSDKAQISGNNVVFQFDMARTHEDEVYFITGGTAGQAANLALNPGGAKKTIRGVSGGSGSAVTKNLDDPHTENTTYTILHDYAKKEYSVWMDGEKVIENAEFRVNTLTGLSYLYLYMQGSRVNTLYLDNFKIYHEHIEGLSGITMATINNGDLSPNITNDLNLPKALPSDPTVPIAWTSDNDTLLSVDYETGTDTAIGRVTLHDYMEANVTLTASVFADGIELCKAFHLAIPYSDKPTKPDRDDEKWHFDEDFDTEPIKGLLEKKGAGTGAAVFLDGKLKLTRSAGVQGNFDAFNYYFNADKSGFTGSRLVVEFEVEREEAKRVNINILSTGHAGVQITWNVDVITALNHDKTATLKTGFTSNTAKFIVEQDIPNRSFSMWVNGERVATGLKFRSTSTNVPNANGIYAYVENTNTNTVYFDNINVYTSIPSIKEQVDTNIDKLKQAITNDGLSTIIPDMDTKGHALSFAYDADDECEVTFSSAEGFVNEDGSINYPDFATEDEVTVTVTKGEYSRSLSYDVTIAGAFVIGEFEFNAPTSGDNFVYLEAYSRNEKQMEVVVVVAAYENGALIAVNIEPQTIMPKSEDEYGNILEGYLELCEAREGITTLKAFIFDSMENLRPLN